VHRAAEKQSGLEVMWTLVKMYRIASSTRLKLGMDQTAWLAANREIPAAQHSGDDHAVEHADRHTDEPAYGHGPA
jgi:D-aminopeptidase